MLSHMGATELWSQVLVVTEVLIQINLMNTNGI